MLISRERGIIPWERARSPETSRPIIVAPKTQNTEDLTQLGHWFGQATSVTNPQFLIYEMNGLDESFLFSQTLVLWTSRNRILYVFISYAFCLCTLHLLEQDLLAPECLVIISFSVFLSAFVAERSCLIGGNNAFHTHTFVIFCQPHFMFIERQEVRKDGYGTGRGTTPWLRRW